MNKMKRIPEPHEGRTEKETEKGRTPKQTQTHTHTHTHIYKEAVSPLLYVTGKVIWPHRVSTQSSAWSPIDGSVKAVVKEKRKIAACS
jgi:hypothetical protein